MRTGRRRALEQEHKNLKPLLLAAVAAVTVVATKSYVGNKPLAIWQRLRMLIR